MGGVSGTWELVVPPLKRPWCSGEFMLNRSFASRPGALAYSRTCSLAVHRQECARFGSNRRNDKVVSTLIRECAGIVFSSPVKTRAPLASWCVNLVYIYPIVNASRPRSREGQRFTARRRRCTLSWMWKLFGALFLRRSGLFGATWSAGPLVV